MKVFVTGASGFVGSAVVKELIANGHQVTGLARSEESAKSISEAGAEVLMGDLENFDILQKGAREADGVIHTAFIHDF
ncbi:MAG: 3-beta hydroxysteroid dehydrogenase, partial [Chryseobacterium sp.]